MHGIRVARVCLRANPFVGTVISDGQRWRIDIASVSASSSGDDCYSPGVRTHASEHADHVVGLRARSRRDVRLNEAIIRL